jgi:DNA-binding CsgD family transcriptional regulator
VVRRETAAARSPAAAAGTASLRSPRRTEAPDPAIPADTVAAWIRASGTPQLARRLLLGMQAEVPISFCFVFLLPPRGPARLVTGASLHGAAAMRAAEAYFAHGYDRFDVNTRRLAARRVARRGDALLTLQTAESIDDEAYRRACYETPGVHSRASVLVAVPGHGHAAVNFYRTLALPRFATPELGLLHRLAPVLGALLEQHMRLLATTQPAGGLDPVLERLTPRERMVIEGIVAGRTTKMIARESGLAEATVNTYRYRAYRRLDIRREKQLFALLRR